MPARFSLVLAILLTLALSRPALAQDAGAPRASADEITALEQQLAVASLALSSGGCAVACPALASMTRAADRICALDPGARCTDARARVRDAARRVREACPECRTGALEAPPPVQAAEGGKQEMAPRAAHPAPDATAVSTEAVAKRGGCAGCVVGGDEPAPYAALLGALALAALRRRRKRG